ncbi:rod shape-determining protein MreD [Vibrio sp. SS-MA-C1-2]|uniref:rod shape-determining protein MreD n=1 Tax=Vibrio sp. SS-MA-C1-2 TaxID=2908646 RepID=UPI001F1F0A75|nr:rod shape-determining protein MreD [Vibrio sp. SS-MA-C1-2]UJF19149.1 rod shape-determining protein MreD [Vibrio sp. SS-MA-C1-2]
MARSGAYNQFIIWVSFFIALILQIMPWPGVLENFRPSWVMLIMCYWVMATPHRINIGSALFLGLIWDLTLGATIGTRGLTMAIIAYIVALNFQLLRNMALWQQAFVIGLLTLAGKVIEFWAEYMMQNIQFDPQSLWAILINFLLWPWVFLFLRRIRRKFGVK